jgi:Flp pilus assembly protein TadD
MAGSSGMQPKSAPGGPQSDIAAAYDLVERGALADAEYAARRAIASSGGRHPGAWTVLGVVLREAQRSAESEAAYRQALKLTPGHIPALHNLGALLSHLERAEEALVSLDRAAALGLKAPELHVNRGKTLAQLYRLDDAERAYEQAVTLDMRNTAAHSSLAQLRFMRGDPLYARDIARAAREHPLDFGLQLAHSELLQRVGDLAGAESVLRNFLLVAGPVPEVRSTLASVLHQMGRLKEAETEALEGAIARPKNAAGIATLVAIELALGQPAAALPFIQAQRRRQPLAQRWIAYEAITARMMGDPLYDKLYDYQRFVRVYELEAPAGFGSMAELNAALVDALAKRHRFTGHPLGQSLRNGRQTARSLVTDDDPAIQGLLSAFNQPLEDYRARLGDAMDHPLTARNRGELTLRGCWSIELRRDGFHVNHIHPAGWLSSAYYVSVPPEVADPQLKSGWIKFGEPKSAVPGIGAAHFVQPQAGRLVLFPSYMWHGTNAIQGDEPRLTVAFDAAPLPPG